MDRLGEEIEDRCGVCPEPVANLLAFHKIKLLAGRNGVEEIRLGRKGLDFFFSGTCHPSPTIIGDLMAHGPKGLEFNAVAQLIMRIPTARGEALAAPLTVTTLLEKLRRKAEAGKSGA